MAAESASMATEPILVRQSAMLADTSVPEFPVLLPFMLKPVEDLRTGWEPDECVVYRPPYYKEHVAYSYCGICLGMPRLPALVKTIGINKCPHVFCSQCISTLIRTVAEKEVTSGSMGSVTAKCPMCRKEFTSRDVVEYEAWHPIMQNLWEEIHVRCPNKGCTFISSPQNVKRHEFDCPNRPYLCPNKGCNEFGTKVELYAHVRDCAMYRTFCSKCATSCYKNGKGEYAEHDCLQELKAVTVMMKRELSKRGVFWPVKKCSAFEPSQGGKADFDSDAGTPSMQLRSLLKRVNSVPMDAAVLTSSPSTVALRGRGNNTTTRAINGSGDDTTDGEDLANDAAVEALIDDAFRSASAPAAGPPIVLVDYVAGEGHANEESGSLWLP